MRLAVSFDSVIPRAASRAEMATSSCSAEGSLVVIFWSHSPGFIITRVITLSRVFPESFSNS